MVDAKIGNGVKLAKANNDNRTVSKLLIQQSRAYFGMLENQDPDSRMMKELREKALKTGNLAAKTAAQTQDMKLEGQSQYWLASLFMLAGKFGDMIQAANDAISLYKQSSNQIGQFNATCLIVKACMKQGKDSRAITVAEDALVLARKIGDKTCEDEATALLKDIASKEVVAGLDMPMAASAAAAAPAPVAASASAAPAMGAVTGYVAPDPEAVKERIISIVADMSGEGAIEEETPFMDAGIDSLSSVELRTNLQKAFGVSLPSTVMFNYPTTLSIADYLVEQMTDNKVTMK